MKAAREICDLVKSNWMSNDKVKSLKRKLGELTAIKTDINIQLEEAESLSGKRRKTEVAYWLRQVERIEDEFRNFEAEMRESSWSMFWGGRVQSLSEEVDELIGKIRFQGRIVLEVFENIGDPFPVTKLAGAAFQENLGKIWVGLTKDENFSIGIWGMGGVGKTTLVTHVYNKLLENRNMFPNVYWITVSNDFSIRKMQDHVARVIGLCLSNQDEENKRAAKLSKALAGKQDFVFILDDLWNPFSMEEVGIPVDKNRCKLILTTRLLDICRRMSCQEKIKLQPLEVEEAWDLFVQKLGNYSTLSKEVEMIAKFVARECKGLPLGIATMAGSMRGVDDISEWRNVLEELRESNGGQTEMEDEVFRILKYSYARLKSPILQQCFLFCALFPEDYAIKRKVLIDHLIFEGQIKGLKPRMSQIDEGHTLLNKLENVCLLESCKDRDKDSCVKMHDLIRDMALNIMKENSKAIVQAGKHLQKFPAEIEWMEDLKRVSLMYNNIKQIPHIHAPRCPNLSTLLISYNPFLSNIADTFFMHLRGLKILDLSYTGIKKLPSTISNLVHLTCLLLNNCRQLRHIPSLAALKTLEKLDLSGTQVKVLPQELEFLSNLIYHDWNHRPLVVVLKLFHLQYLSLPRSPAIKGELGSLSELEYLSCRFNNAHDFYSYFCCGLQALNEDQRKLLNKYLLAIGKWVHFSSSSKYLKELSKVVVFRECDIGKEGKFVAIPKDLEGLFIYDCHDARSLCDVSLPENSTSLKVLRISRCRSFECLGSFSSSSNIISQNGGEGNAILLFINSGAFSCLKRFQIAHCPSIKSLFLCQLLPSLQNLEEVEVSDCKQLETITYQNGREGDATLPFIQDGAFSCLKRFQIVSCPRIQSLFPCQLLPDLQNLEEVKVCHCKQLEAIIAQNMGEGDATLPFIAFSCLKRFQIANCPRIHSLFPCQLLPNLQNLEEVEVSYCEQLETITYQNGREGDATLPFMHGGAFSCLKRFKIARCPLIKSLFLCQLLPNLQNLEEVEVSYCEQLEAIINQNVGEGDATLPFIHDRAFSCLKRFQIAGCPLIQSLFPCQLLPNLQNLEEVKVRDCEQLEAIISQNMGEGDATLPFIHGGAFSCLKRFQIASCPRIQSLFPCQLLPNIQNLEEVKVYDCEQLEAIISQNMGEGDATLPFIHGGAFSCLKRFQIASCPRIHSLFPCQLLPNLQNLEEVKVCHCKQLEAIINQNGGKGDAILPFIHRGVFSLERFKKKLPKRIAELY